jgi:UDP-N-acetylglucosamine 2-epimerase (non-hydrolysing)
MSSNKKVLIAFGTRPEAIKLAPVILELKKQNIDIVTVSTGQHREMLDQVLDIFNIKPDYDLFIMSEAKNLSEMASKILVGVDEIINNENPDVVVTQGDTTSAFVSGLAAFHNRVKIAHVEAGLRTYNKYSPYPEEMNRKLLGSMADYHFAPTANAKNALLKEGIDEKSIFVTGNTVIDALEIISEKNLPFNDRKLEAIDFENKNIILLTTHRRENLDSGMKNIFDAINQITEMNTNLEIIFPVHLNPVIGNLANNELRDNKSVHLLDPLSYSDLVGVLKKCKLVLTDSGGIQEEAPAFGKPVLVLRETTERTEGVDAGTCKLVGLETDKIVAETNELLNNQDKYQDMAKAINPYGDGTASKKIIEVIINDRQS